MATKTVSLETLRQATSGEAASADEQRFVNGLFGDPSLLNKRPGFKAMAEAGVQPYPGSVYATLAALRNETAATLQNGGHVDVLALAEEYHTARNLGPENNVVANLGVGLLKLAEGAKVTDVQRAAIATELAQLGIFSAGAEVDLTVATPYPADHMSGTNGAPTAPQAYETFYASLKSPVVA